VDIGEDMDYNTGNMDIYHFVGDVVVEVDMGNNKKVVVVVGTVVVVKVFEEYFPVLIFVLGIFGLFE